MPRGATTLDGASLLDPEEARGPIELPFYLYEGPAFDDGSWFIPCARGLRGEGVTEDQYSGEFFFLRQLRAHRWRTRDPESALLFVVPLYANAALQPSVKGTSCNGTHYQTLFDNTAAAVARTPQYARHQGADHILLCSSWRFASRMPKQAPWAPTQLSTEAFRYTFRNAIVGHMETHHAADDGFWRCSVVSPYPANYDETRQPHRRPPTDARRDVSFFFQGGANNRGTCEEAPVSNLPVLPPRPRAMAARRPRERAGLRGAAGAWAQWARGPSGQQTRARPLVSQVVPTRAQTATRSVRPCSLSFRISHAPTSRPSLSRETTPRRVAAESLPTAAPAAPTRPSRTSCRVRCVM